MLPKAAATVLQAAIPKAIAPAGPTGASSSSHEATPAAGVAVVAAASDTVTVRRSALEGILDCVERTQLAAAHAVRISTSARNAFEEEAARISEASRALRRLLDRRD